MRNGLCVSVLAAAVVPLLAGGGVASADPVKRTIELTCVSGTFSGTATGSALHLEGGGIVVAQGITDAATQQVLVKTTPGLERAGKLERCTYFSSVSEKQLIAFVLFA